MLAPVGPYKLDDLLLLTGASGILSHGRGTISIKIYTESTLETEYRRLYEREQNV